MNYRHHMAEILQIRVDAKIIQSNGISVVKNTLPANNIFNLS